MKISELLRDYTLPQWVDFPGVEGFRVQVQLPDNALQLGVFLEGRSLGGRVLGAKMLAALAVADWSGLTVAGLRQLVKEPVSGEDAKEIPCTPDNVEMLLKFSPTFYLFLLGQIHDREAEAAREAGELKN